MTRTTASVPGGFPGASGPPGPRACRPSAPAHAPAQCCCPWSFLCSTRTPRAHSGQLSGPRGVGSASLPCSGYLCPPHGVKAGPLPRQLSVMRSTHYDGLNFTWSEPMDIWPPPPALKSQRISWVLSVLYSLDLHRIRPTLPVSPEWIFSLRIFKPSHPSVLLYIGFPLHRSPVQPTPLPTQVSPFLKITD